MWYLYIIRCGDNTLYTGITTNVERRLGEHKHGGPRSAKYLRSRGPLQLVAQIEVGDQGRATRLEYHIKALPRIEKERLVDSPVALQNLVKIFEECKEKEGH